MTATDFESVGEGLYAFSTSQREGLLDLLQSRLWLYESGDYPEFERIFEFDDNAIKIILRGMDLESLAYALKSGPQPRSPTQDMIKAKEMFYRIPVALANEPSTKATMPLIDLNQSTT